MQQLIEVVVKVVIIGAGISGIGASLELSKNNVEHIIIEGRDRVGGRITSRQFDGVTIQLGASYVHYWPNSSNRIYNIMQQQGWNYTVANKNQQQFLYDGKEQISESTIQKASDIVLELCGLVADKEASSKIGLSLQEAAGNFFNELNGTTQQAKNAAKWYLNYLGNKHGAQLSDLSAKQCKFLQNFDYLPNGGYSKLFEHIYSKNKAKEVKLNQKVIKIDYSTNLIKVYTQKHVYLTRTVISSLPLGVLQSNKVQFIPCLPESHQKVINKLGNGMLNKLFISFEQPFWDTKSQWINFITKQNNNYPMAASIAGQGKYILCIFLSAGASKQTSQLSDQQILDDFLLFLKRFNFDQQIQVRAFEVTRWQLDPFSQGSYSYNKVGTTPEDINTLRSPIDNKIWFIGQHCHPILFSSTHGAFETGVWAGQQVSRVIA